MTDEEFALSVPRDGVAFFPLRCPACRSKWVTVYRTDWPVRWHRCNNPRCGHRFKSVEQGERGVPESGIEGVDKNRVS